ncbi:MAG: histidine phosphatase family protein [Neisseria sp.]|nr:histidine phosphatase family protein [Neisseria sp.]
MNLILWRHAEAEYGPPDLERALTNKGHDQARIMAAWLQRHLPAPYRLWASEAQRSRQTAACLGSHMQVFPALNPDIDARSLPQLLEHIGSDDTVVIVGHQPWLGELSAFLLNENWEGGTYWSYKKGGFWWFQVKHSDGRFYAKLKAALTPAVLMDSAV